MLGWGPGPINPPDTNTVIIIICETNVTVGTRADPVRLRGMGLGQKWLAFCPVLAVMVVLIKLFYNSIKCQEHVITVIQKHRTRDRSRKKLVLLCNHTALPIFQTAFSDLTTPPLPPSPPVPPRHKISILSMHPRVFSNKCIWRKSISYKHYPKSITFHSIRMTKGKGIKDKKNHRISQD